MLPLPLRARPSGEGRWVEGKKSRVLAEKEGKLGLKEKKDEDHFQVLAFEGRRLGLTKQSGLVHLPEVLHERLHELLRVVRQEPDLGPLPLSTTPRSFAKPAN